MLSISTLTRAISAPNSFNWNNLTGEWWGNYGTDRIVQESHSCAGANYAKIPILFDASCDTPKVIISKITYEMIGLLECCKLWHPCTLFFFFFVKFMKWQFFFFMAATFQSWPSKNDCIWQMQIRSNMDLQRYKSFAPWKTQSHWDICSSQGHQRQAFKWLCLTLWQVNARMINFCNVK